VGSDEEEEDHFHKAWLCYLHTTTLCCSLLVLFTAFLRRRKRRHKEELCSAHLPTHVLVFQTHGLD
jgi:hypothetical protein